MKQYSEIDTLLSNYSDRLKQFCKKNHIRKLSLFGSALRGDFNKESDIDILVEFRPENVPGLIKLSRMENELSMLFGRKVDLRTPQDLSVYFREEVLSTIKVHYAES